MNKLLIIILLALSFSAIGQTRIISGANEQTAGITSARQWVYFHSPEGEYTSFDINVEVEGSGTIYGFTWNTEREFNHHYQLPAYGFTYEVSFFCFNYITGNYHEFTKIIEL